MASLTTSNRTGNRRILFYDLNRKRKSICLGKLPKKKCLEILRYVESILAAELSNSPLDSETAAWLGGLPEKFRSKLVSVGLADQSASIKAITLRDLTAKFLALQVVKPSTKASYKQTTDGLLDHFGEDCLIGSVDASGVDEWYAGLTRQGLSAATIAKRVNTAKTVFNRAVRWGHLQSSPFQHLSRGTQENKKRLQYISRETIHQVLACCPNHECRVIVGLARFGGLRCPSEFLTLKWGDVDLDRGSMRIHSDKTERSGMKAVRDVPICPELRQLLAGLPRGAADEPVITRIKSPKSNLRKMLLTAVKKAGLPIWPRAFQNLRASCEMDFNEVVPIYTAAEWMGHSATVSEKHYVRTRGEHFERVTKLLASTETTDAKSNAVMTRNQSPHEAATTCIHPQSSLQLLLGGGSMRINAEPRRSARKEKVGDGGLEPSTSRV